MNVLRVAEKFGRYPGGRFASDGDFSGEAFREEHLAPALLEARAQGEKLTVDLDGVIGFAASFLEEAFGGLVRTGKFTAEELHGLLELKTTQRRFSIYEAAIWDYIDGARRDNNEIEVRA